MTKVLTEGSRRTGEYIISEAEHYRSREEGVCAPGVETTYEAGTVLGIETATGELKMWDPTASDGTENVVGVLYEAMVSGDPAEKAKRAYTARDAQVKQSKLAFNDALSAAQVQAGIDGLAALGIVTRKSVGDA